VEDGMRGDVSDKRGPLHRLRRAEGEMGNVVARLVKS
jgi:hypothetical protein